MKVDSKKIYNKVRQAHQIYDEELHCKMVIESMNESGSIAAFCTKAGISDKLFYKWCNKYEIFDECYRIGAMISLANWEKEGEERNKNEDFNIEIWRIKGSARYGIGKSNRIRVHVDENTTPFEQYKQLLKQASYGDFTAAEVKQLMESINIGCRAYESFELQKEVDTMKENLTKMNQYGNNIVSIEKAKETNSNPVPDSVCESAS